MDVVPYVTPSFWINYDDSGLIRELTDAKAAVLSLKAMPFQRRWVEELQKIQLKMEVAGTSQIEGADFAANELDVAMQADTPEQLLTRSQRQANAAVRTYKWIATVPSDRPIDEELICETHRLIVTDCDSDHCEPGAIRRADQNVTFGVPKHRGAIGGAECTAALEGLTRALETTFRGCDPLIQALALHYHFAAIHPFSDGNGRTARALEALMLQRAGLRDCLFIAMSNYYYEEKKSYLEALAAVRAANHDLTPFLKFGLKGIALQSQRLTRMIKNAVEKEIFRNLMNDLFVRLRSTRKRVIVKRQLILLNDLLEREGRIEFYQLAELMKKHYSTRKDPYHAIARDLSRLRDLGAVNIVEGKSEDGKRVFYVSVRLDWPTTITETEFFKRLASLPKSKTYAFLST